MKRNVIWLLSTLSVVVLLFGYHTSTSGALGTSAGTAITSSAQPDGSTTTSGQGGSGSGSGSGSGGSTGGTSGGQSQGNGGQSGSGGSGSTTTTRTVTGDTVQTAWGPVQVELTVKDGSITDVSVLQYPNGNPQDQQINAYALPILVQDTLDAQSANIDMISGATITSTGYVESLQSALDQAGL
ncbi:FMN-binding protein [Nocardioides sp. MAHUQ-72]|uniref:FMN-binding protein n=1 Tax=unclassified Nocardioides TaxID=2615069 RepID=UPI003611BCF8